MKCLVCKSDFTKYYEELRDKEMPIPKIYDECIKIGDKFSIQSLYRHFQNHYNSEGIKVIPEELALYVVMPIFKDYVNRYNIERVMSFLHKYLDKPYCESKKELYRALKSVIENLDDFDTDTFDELWNQAINQPIQRKPFSGLSFNEYFEK